MGVKKIIKFMLKEKIDPMKVKNKNFLDNKKLSEISNGIYFLNIVSIKVSQKIIYKEFNYSLNIEFSYLKNYFFLNEKLKKLFIKFICKKILFSFLNLRGNSKSFSQSNKLDIYFDFYYFDEKIKIL